MKFEKLSEKDQEKLTKLTDKIKEILQKESPLFAQLRFWFLEERKKEEAQNGVSKA